MHSCVKFSTLPKTGLTVISNLAQVVIIVVAQEVWVFIVLVDLWPLVWTFPPSHQSLKTEAKVWRKKNHLSATTCILFPSSLITVPRKPTKANTQNPQRGPRAEPSQNPELREQSRPWRCRHFNPPIWSSRPDPETRKRRQRTAPVRHFYRNTIGTFWHRRWCWGPKTNARAKTVPSGLFFLSFFLSCLWQQSSLRKPITVHPHTPIRRRRTTTSITPTRARVHVATHTSGQHCPHVVRAAKWLWFNVDWRVFSPVLDI